MTSDGKPYGPKRYRGLIKECWYLCDNLHIDYQSALALPTKERGYLISLINEKLEAQRAAVEEIKARSKK